jgi:hypothetical protein
VRLVRHIFLSSHLINLLACGFSTEIQRIFKKCIIWWHFPILELKNSTYPRETESGELMLSDLSSLGLKNKPASGRTKLRLEGLRRLCVGARRAVPFGQHLKLNQVGQALPYV